MTCQGGLCYKGLRYKGMSENPLDHPTRTSFMRRTAYILCCLLWATPVVAASPAGAPSVAVTLTPLHSLTVRLMAGVSLPRQIIHSGISPHRYAPRPSEVRALHNSDLIIWVGETAEPGLAKTIRAVGSDVRVITLGRRPELDLLPARTGGVFSAAADSHTGHADNTDHAGHTGSSHLDPHFWLDPRRAQAAAGVIAAALIALDPGHEVTYKANLALLSRDLDALHRELEDQFSDMGDKPFFVFHDAYQYLERRYGLKVLGTVAASADRPPGAKRLIAIRHRLAQEKSPCILYEPQFKPALISVLVEGIVATQGPLDPLGANISPGPDHYFDLMRAAARSIRACASGAQE